MKRGAGPAGFTIVEVLIFLAATAFLFVIAAVAINGRQQQVEVLSASRNLQKSIELVASQVTNGFFPSNGINCTLVGGTINISVNNAAQQGTHSDCIFMGKIIQFRPSFNDLRVITIAGRRLNSAGEIVDKFADATPVAVPPLDDSINASNLNVTHVWYKQNNLDTPQEIGAFGYLIRFPESLSGGIQEASNVNLIALQPSSLTDNKNSIDNAINADLVSYTIPGNGVNPFEIVMCYQYHANSGDIPGILQYSTVGRKTYSEIFIGKDQVFKFQIAKGWTYC